MADVLNIWATSSANYVNGPGRRFVVWTQGCHLACPECWNKHTWAFEKKTLLPVDALFDQISVANAAHALDGVTFTGGEPFLQAGALARLAGRVKGELGLNVQIFTGFELAELRKAPQKALLALADVVVAGRYDPRLPNNNQKVHEGAALKWAYNNTDVQIEISAEGEMLLTGYPSDDLIRHIEDAIA